MGFKRNIMLTMLIFCAQVTVAENDDSYEFYGRHFIASYRECDAQALEDITSLLEAFARAVRASGATILSSDKALFPGNGLTASFLLSESHATIHTYPEHCACFVDLFTCGHTCSHEQFDKILTEYLKAKKVTSELCIRN